MKKVFILFILIFGCYNLFAQPNIAYIIPDIGAPGMNTYMEIIADTDDKGTFGQDGMYINGVDVDGSSTDNVYIEFVDNADSNRVTFGPVIVSWEGRMISTQVFVHPDITPNDWDWENLNDDYKIEFTVNVNGNSAPETQTFFIVNPTPVGDITGTAENVLGEGNLGKRSPRGAMIVDSIIFNSIKYTISTNDCDPATPGNQAYLPFVLLSEGPLVGQTGTEISLSSDDYGYHQDAAPGGGGGGGRFCDVTSGSGGDDGGKGFTGGGPGGYNRYLEPGNIGGWNDPGMGTGDINGKSLNNVNPGQTPVGSAAESAGGGTGHPFGLSGQGAITNGDKDRDGGYGAGSGWQRDWAGGGAGYGEDGVLVGSNNFHGKAHGNIMVVPIAGGSGGASGNPQGDLIGTYCSGNGGGGGGALHLYGTKIINGDFLAQGGLGGNGHDGSNGGSGSGGYVGLFSKLPSNQIDINVDGNQRSHQDGRTGQSGRGRARADIPNPVIVNPQDVIQNGFIGPTSDTSSFVKRKNHVLRGTKDPDETILIYLKSETGNWQRIGLASANSQDWFQLLDLPDEDLYFLFVVQQIQTDNDGDYDDEPKYVLSQAAANILRIDKDPEIAGDTLVKDTVISCTGYDLKIPFEIWNEGEGNLDLDFAGAIFLNSNSGFSKRDPLVLTTINGTPLGDTDYDSLTVEVDFEFFPGTYDQNETGFIRDTLLIPNNDPDEDPWLVAFEVYIEDFLVTSHDLENDPLFENPIDSLYLGEVCRGGSTTKDFILMNRSPFQINVNDPRLKLDNGFEAIKNFTLPLDSDDASSVTVNYIDESTVEDQIYNVITFTSIECPGKIIDSVVVWVDLVDVLVEATEPTIFEETRVGNTSTEDIIFENNGTADLLLEDIADITVNQPYYVNSVTPAPPVLIKPGDKITVSVDFAPLDTLDNPNIRFLTIEFNATDTTCKGNVAQELQGKAIQSNLEISKMIMDFGTVRHCEIPSDTVMISNSGNTTISIIAPARIEGQDASDFIITSDLKTIPVDITDKSSGGVKYFVQFTPQTPGDKEAELVIETDDPENPEIRIRLVGRMEPFNVTPTLDPIDLGDLDVGFDYNFTIELNNNGYFGEHFIDISNPTGADYNINTADFDQFITPNNTIEIRGTVNLKQAGAFSETLYCTFEYETDYVDEDGDTIYCRDEVEVNIIANGLTSQMEVTDELDIGLLPPCGDSIVIIEYAHKLPESKARFVILSETMQNNPSGLFNIESTLINPPDTLDVSANRYGATVRFDPRGAADGIYQCQIRTEFYINGQVRDTLITIRGEVQGLDFTITDNPLDFGEVVVNTGPVQEDIIISNNGPWIMTINSFSPIVNTGIFTMSPDPTGATLLPGDNFTVTVTFEPGQNINYSENITFEIKYSGFECLTADVLAINGNGGTTKKIQLRLPEVVVEPDIDDYKLPVYARLIKEGNEEDLSGFKIDSLQISFNRTLFYPVDVSNGKIIENFTLLNDRFITLEIDDISLTENESVLTEITGYTMLGNVKSTPIDFSKAPAHSSPDIVSEIYYLDGSGKMDIEICEEGGDRLLNVLPSDATIIANPNPASDVVNIEILPLEQGNHYLKLSDINGNIKELNNWNVTNNDKIEFMYNSSDLSSGMYYLILQSPNRIYKLPVFIVK